MWIKKTPTLWVDDNVTLEGKIMFKEGKLLTTVNRNTVIVGTVDIGEGVLIGHNCTIISTSHNFEYGRPIREQENTNKRITIEDDVWIGAGAIILGGVHIKKGAVIGAGSVVVSDKVVGENEIWVGVPARYLRLRSI